MKILFIHHCGSIGGGSISCCDVLHMLRDLGHEVILMIPSPAPKIVDFCDKNNIQVIDMPYAPIHLDYYSASGGWFRALTKYLISYRKYDDWQNEILEMQVDLVLLNSIVMSPMIDLIKKKKIPVGIFIRETMHGYKIYPLNQLIKKKLQKADMVSFLTSYDQLEWNLNNKNQVVVPDIVDVAQFETFGVAESEIKKNLGIADECKIILYLGGIMEQKGSYILLAAIEKVLKQVDQEVCLVILGDDGKKFLNYSGLNRLIYKDQVVNVKKCYEIINKYPQCVKLMGVVSNIYDWYTAADYVVFPVKKIHQARPVYEAGYFSKPIILPNYPNFYENVKDAYNGFLYSKNDTDDLAEKMIIFIDDDELREECGRNNYLMYKAGHSYKYAKEILGDVLSKLER